MRHFRLSLIGLLILTLTTVPLAGCMPTSEGEAWKDKYETLLLENTFLKAELETAQADIGYLKSASEALRDDYNSLKANYDTLKGDYALFEGVYDAQKAAYDSLNDNYDTLKALYDDVTNELAEIKKSSPSTPASTPAPTTVPTSTLKKGLRLVAQDGTYLGTLDSQFGSESIFNDFGRYGSEFSSTSIWNDFSQYGSKFSSLSAFNELASKPPMLFDEDNFICYVTTNTLKIPRVSPYSLIAFAESMGWK